MKIVINDYYRGCLLSLEAVEELKLCGFEPTKENFSDMMSNWKSVLPFVYNSDLDKLKRHDLRLISVIEKLGSRAETYLSKFKIISVDENKKYHIMFDPFNKKEKLIYHCFQNEK